jgi:hypothetical protein
MEASMTLQAGLDLMKLPIVTALILWIRNIDWLTLNAALQETGTTALIYLSVVYSVIKILKLAKSDTNSSKE